MKRIILSSGLIVLSACSGLHSEPQSNSVVPSEQACIGTTQLPKGLKDDFIPVVDDSLLESSLGEPKKGKLCQGQVYQSKADTQVALYRAWNSTNPNSQFGSWWAFNLPSGKIAQYRQDYEICYQWSPLDKMVSCTLKAGTKVVVGNGQSAECSEYLTYNVSSSQQVYLEQASDALYDCKEFDGVMSWQLTQ